VVGGAEQVILVGNVELPERAMHELGAVVGVEGVASAGVDIDGETFA